MSLSSAKIKVPITKKIKMKQKLKDILMAKIGNCYGMRSNSKEKEFAEVCDDENAIAERLKEIKTYCFMTMNKKIDSWYEMRSNSSPTPEQEEEFAKLSHEILMLNPMFEKYFDELSHEILTLNPMLEKCLDDKRDTKEIENWLMKEQK